MQSHFRVCEALAVFRLVDVLIIVRKGAAFQKRPSLVTAVLSHTSATRPARAGRLHFGHVLPVVAPARSVAVAHHYLWNDYWRKRCLDNGIWIDCNPLTESLILPEKYRRLPIREYHVLGPTTGING